MQTERRKTGAGEGKRFRGANRRSNRQAHRRSEALGFPPLEIWATVGNIYQAFFIHLPRILRLSLIPFLISCATYIFSDLYLAATNVNNVSFWITTVIVQCVEVLLFYLFSLSIYRLMLLGNWESLVGLDARWRARFITYAFRSISVFLPLILVIFVSWIGLRFLVGFSMYALYLIPFIMLAIYWLFLRLGFALPAASVDAPYSIRDSWRATSFISVRVLMIGIFTVGPPLLMFVATIVALNSIQPGIELEIADGVAYEINTSYWIIAPIGILLSYLVAAFVVITTAIMFYFRTGWRPGAVRADK